MKSKHILSFLGLLFITLTGYANLKTSNISLTSGTIKPHETLMIPLNSLLPGVAYKVVVRIADMNNKENPLTLKAGQINDYGWSDCFISLNGENVGSQFNLNQDNNVLEFTNLAPMVPITLTNLDDTDSIAVTAVAMPEIGF